MELIIKPNNYFKIENLSIWTHIPSIINIIKASEKTVIVGPSGIGKTVGIPIG